MRKQTLRTSAIALGIAAALPATAQEWNVGWGGYMRQYVIFGDNEHKTTMNPGNAQTIATIERSGISQRRDTEIFFKPSVTLENGIKFGVTVELEGDGEGVDESYMTIGSDALGQLILGAENSVGHRMMFGGPTVTSMWTNSGIHGSFIPVKTGGLQAAGSSTTEVGSNNDVMRVSYHTPSLGGLSLGVSYADGGGGNNGNNSGYLTRSKTDNTLSDIMDVAARFNQAFGEADVTLAARYGTAKHNGASKKPMEFGVGLRVGFGAFTIGGSYNDSKRVRAGEDGYSSNHSSDGWSLGMTYDMEGPWKFGIDTYQGEWDDGDTTSVAKVGASRTLGPGVSWDLFALTARSKDNDSSSGGDMIIEEGSGTLFGTAVNLSF